MVTLKIKLNDEVTSVEFDELSNYEMFQLNDNDCPLTLKLDILLATVSDIQNRVKIKIECNRRPGLVVSLISKVLGLFDTNGKETTQDKLVTTTFELSQTILYEIYSVIMRTYSSYTLDQVRALKYVDLFLLANMSYAQINMPYYLKYIMNRSSLSEKFKEQTGQELTYEDYVLILANDGEITDIHDIKSDKDRKRKTAAQPEAMNRLKKKRNLLYEQTKGSRVIDSSTNLGENFEPSANPTQQEVNANRQLDVQSHAENSAKNSLKAKLSQEKMLKQKGLTPKKNFNWDIEEDVRFDK